MPEKYREEIEEILKQSEESQKSQKAPNGQKGNKPLKLPQIPLGRFFSQRGWRVSPGKLILAAVSLFLAALILRLFIPSTVGPLIWAGLGLFILAYALFFVRPGATGYEKRWRGRPLESRDSFWSKVKRWLSGR